MHFAVDAKAKRIAYMHVTRKFIGKALRGLVGGAMGGVKARGALADGAYDSRIPSCPRAA